MAKDFILKNTSIKSASDSVITMKAPEKISVPNSKPFSLDYQKSLFFEAEELKKNILKKIYDQDIAVEKLVDDLIRSSCYESSKSQPKAVLTFIGQPFSGKSFLAEQLSINLKDYNSFKLIDMSRYSNPEESDYLFGSNQINTEPIEGELITFIKKNPQSIIFFDEIDKAEISVQNYLLDLFVKKSPVDFSKSIIIFSTTLGKSFYHNTDLLFELKDDKIRAQHLLFESLSNEKKLIIDTYFNTFSEKFLEFLAQNPFIIFKNISIESMGKIGQNSIQQQAKHFTKETGIAIDFTNKEILSVSLSLSLVPNINAKNIKVKLPEIIFNKINEFIKREKLIPKKIIFSVTKREEKNLKKILRKHEFIEKELSKKGEYLKLKWKEKYEKGVLTFKLFSSEFTKISLMINNNEKIPILRSGEIEFKDIAGQSKTKENLKEIIGLLKKTNLLSRFKIDMPKGMVLYGPQGTGKITLAKAFAKEADLQYIQVSGSELFDPVYLNSVYEKARENTPCLVILQEIDIKGIVDGIITNISSESLISQLNTLNNKNVFTIATLTKKEEIDPEIFSPGNLDILVEVPELDKEARRFYINKILEKPNDGKINIDRVVHYISGMNGNDLERLGKEVALAAIKNKLDYITEEILIEQINIIKYGNKLEGNKIKDFEEDLKKTAYHEAGHAILSLVLRPKISIEQVTILARSESLGFVSYKIEDYLKNVSRKEIMDNICVLLGGRVAKIKEFGKDGMDSGSIYDLEQATAQAYFAISSLGMDDELGFVSIGLIENNGTRILQSRIEERLIDWIKDATLRTEELVERHWFKIISLAELLIKKEVVEGFELEKIMNE